MNVFIAHGGIRHDEGDGDVICVASTAEKAMARCDDGSINCYFYTVREWVVDGAGADETVWWFRVKDGEWEQRY